MRRLALLVAIAGVVVALCPGNVWAHAVLEETAPADGAVLAESPPQVTLRFNEIVSVRDGAVNVVGPDGAAVELAEVAAVDSTVHVSLPATLAEGSYVVSWRVVSADSHPVAGAFVFSVGAPSSAAAAPAVSSEAPGWAIGRAVATFVVYLGTLLAVGLAVFVVFVHDGGRERALLRSIAVASAGVGLLGAAATVPFHVVDLVGDGARGLGDIGAWGDVLGGPPGVAAIVTVAGLVGVVAATRTATPRMMVDVVLGAAAAIALGGFVISGHTRAFGPWWLVVTSDLVHLAGAAVWLGGLVGLVVVLRGRLGGEPTSVSTDQIVLRFSTLAMLSVALVALFGTLMAWRIVGSLSALVGGSYGTTLLVKVSLVAVVVGLGAYNRLRLIPGHRRNSGERGAQLARVVRIEAVVLVLVVAGTAILVDRSPVSTANAGDIGGRTVVDQPLQVDLDVVTADVVVEPGRVGANHLTITLRDRDDLVADVAGPVTVELRLAERAIGPIVYDASVTAPGRYERDLEFVVAGRWEIRLAVRVDAYTKPIGVAYFEVVG